MTERTTGYIKWFNLARRYGFIRRETFRPMPQHVAQVDKVQSEVFRPPSLPITDV